MAGRTALQRQRTARPGPKLVASQPSGKMLVPSQILTAGARAGARARAPEWAEAQAQAPDRLQAQALA